MLGINEKIDILFKKLLYRKGTTSKEIGKPYYIEPDSDFNVSSQNVLIDLKDLPTSKPTIYNNGDKFDKNGVLTTDDDIAVMQYFEENAVRYTSSYNVYKLSTGMIISSHIANGVYAPTLWNNTTQISNNINTYLDHDNGTIIFYDTDYDGIENIIVKGWRYIGKTLADSIGGVKIEKLDIQLQTDGVLTNNLTWDGTYFTYIHNFGDEEYFYEIKDNFNRLILTEVKKTSNNIEILFDYNILQADNIHLILKHLKVE